MASWKRIPPGAAQFRDALEQLVEAGEVCGRRFIGGEEPLLWTRGEDLDEDNPPRAHRASLGRPPSACRRAPSRGISTAFSLSSSWITLNPSATAGLTSCSSARLTYSPPRGGSAAGAQP